MVEDVVVIAVLAIVVAFFVMLPDWPKRGKRY